MNLRKVILLVAALAAFELFNFSVTEYALTDLIGEASVLGIRWVIILTSALCLMDLAGAYRLLLGRRGNVERLDVWFLLSAWFLVITFNSLLIWWGISLALFRRGDMASEIVWLVPVVVAVLAAVLRVVLVGQVVSAAGGFSAEPESIEP